FGGNPVSAAAALWMLGQINRPGFLGKVRKRGRELNAALVALAARQEVVREARGLGLLQAIELTKESGLDPRAVSAAAREEGLLVGRGGERAIRLLPPLNVTPEEITEAVQKLEAALHRAGQTIRSQPAETRASSSSGNQEKLT
ncbi:MAG TPA: aminotransferase class III-fold pyridoxal phosphate-dependent enzyme, partial [Solirubrobacterales bacterium]|nr:aminotransferase class III-fold pyridoxal phosphate-dependent enzyme [Solirubrobacterales bacterium]